MMKKSSTNVWPTGRDVSDEVPPGLRHPTGQPPPSIRTTPGWQVQPPRLRISGSFDEYGVAGSSEAPIYSTYKNSFAVSINRDKLDQLSISSSSSGTASRWSCCR